MVEHFFNEVVQKAETRVAHTKQSARLLLDKNEQSDDVNIEIKKRVTKRLLDTNWNRYPDADHRKIEAKVAEYCGLEQENIVLGAGSASLITTLLNYFALNQKHIVITQPSYSLFDYHCKTYGIPYQAWNLTYDLEYDCQNLPRLGSDSVLIITSPNNPTGNTISLATLERLLTQHPESFIILDAVYCEFGAVDMTPLVQKYPNLLVLRSFSKAFPIAGLRLGYLCAAPKTAAIVKKLVLQFSINPFSLIFADEMLQDRAFMENAKKRVRDIIAERERMRRLINHRFGRGVLHAYKSEGNFLLIRIFDHAAFENLMADLPKNGIKVLNTSATPLLKNTFRVSIGTQNENETFFHHLKTSLEQSILPVRAKVVDNLFHLSVVKAPKPMHTTITGIPVREAVSFA